MGILVVNGAQLVCSFGTAPSVLTIIPGNTMVGGAPAATIRDMNPMQNIAPFAMCNSMANPTVASATAAAMGVLTPMPCVPVIPAPWVPGSTSVMIGGVPTVNNTCTLTCAYGGVITITNPGQTKTLAN